MIRSGRDAPEQAPVGERMRARDAVNLFFESDRSMASVVHNYFIDLRGVDAPLRTHADAVRFARTVVGLHPIFRRRLQRVRWDLDYPSWVEVPMDDAELGRHVFVTTAGPDARQDCIDKIVELSVTDIGMDSPPWQMHFLLDVHGVDGVPDGATMMTFRSHHSAVDGMGVVALTNRMLSAGHAAGATPTVATSPDALDEHVSNLVRIASPARAVARLPRGLVAFARAGVAGRRARRALTSVSPAATTRPAIRFNRNVPAEMTFDFTWFDMRRVIALKNALGPYTVNDVMLTVVSLALADYLREDGELPAESLGTTIPISTRPLGSTGSANQLTFGLVSLHTDIDDPIERLSAIAASASRAKDRGAMFASRLPEAAVFSAPAAVLKLLCAVTPRRPLEPKRVKANTMVTNVPYGRGPLTLQGAPMCSVMGPLPTVEGINLSHAIATFGDTMSVSATSIRSLMPDTARYMGHLRAAFARLETAARAEAAVEVPLVPPATEVPAAPPAVIA